MSLTQEEQDLVDVAVEFLLDLDYELTADNMPMLVQVALWDGYLDDCIPHTHFRTIVAACAKLRELPFDPRKTILERISPPST